MGGDRNHRFRASGWTRHYVTFAELMQMIALLALGLALAHLRNHGPNMIFQTRHRCCWFVNGRSRVHCDENRDRRVCDWCECDGVAVAARHAESRVYISRSLLCLLSLRWSCGKHAIEMRCCWAIRARHCVSSGACWVVEILIHPVFGHGMDACSCTGTRWGFPGKDMLHLHSTPLQLAFDRGFAVLALHGCG